MKNDYKSIYIIMTILLLLFSIFFTLANVLVFGSVMQVNLAILTLLLVFPLYQGFKTKLYYKKTALFMGSYFCLILITTVLIIPNYTFKEARSAVEIGEDVEWTLHLKRHTSEFTFFYKGDYLIETSDGQYSFDFKEGYYTKIIE